MTHMHDRQPAWAGWSLMAIGAIHVASTPWVYRESLASIRGAGVIGSIERDPELIPLRGVGFWYATAGVAVFTLGAAVRHVERSDGRAPAWLGGALLALTAGGVTLMPASGFWAFLFPATAALLGRRRARALTERRSPGAAR